MESLEGVDGMFGGVSSVPSWFYLVAFAVVLLLVLFIEWKTR
ncbi:hypothetical protein ABZ756_10560 [Mammaliicoccus sciuri]|uniref:Uncharacterized protein n=1 Tax=Sporosarcina newyorkensis 2681 TaxID=1027292 RepID=F9DS24_9BACL|nr:MULTISPECIES: hypothetical protein [Sporosarcina]EGQ26324.1 hypothetical protein HMPREF9372_1604 [Sporosarcina newyorkensis 2681]